MKQCHKCGEWNFNVPKDINAKEMSCGNCGAKINIKRVVNAPNGDDGNKRTWSSDKQFLLDGGY